MNDFHEITKQLKNFRDKRNWKKFHKPKDMAMAISIESAELLELFLWKTNKEIQNEILTNKEKLADELADIAMYILLFADELNIDLYKAIKAKIQKNEIKYPAYKCKGKNIKYNKL